MPIPCRPPAAVPNRASRSFGHRVLLALACGAGAASAFAQRVVVAEPGVAPVAVETAALAAEITGTIAVTTYDLVIRNPNDRALEGTFEFPLLDGQQVIRFALDVGGQLREAVPVEKERGRVVFEQIERAGVDPGLLEQTAGNNYRARIFPLPAQGTRRIVIACQENLRRTEAGGAGYRLALDFPERLKRFSLHATAHHSGKTPAGIRTTLPVGPLEWNDAKVLAVEREDFTAKGLLEIDVPAGESPALHTETFGGREYFCADVPLRAGKTEDRPKPRVLGLLWDASGSGRDRDRARELAFLDAWFRAVPDVEVRVQLLRDTAERLAPVKVRRGDWAKLRQALEAVVYDGGTSFDGVRDEADADEWMLFSDGLVNFGTATTPLALADGVPLHAVAASLRADPARLKAWAEPRGGAFVDLLGVDAAAAVARVRSAPLRVLGIGDDSGAVAELWPAAGSIVSDGTLTVTGILRRKSARVRLRLGHSAADARVFEVTVRSAESPGKLAARAWASAKIAALSRDPAANREELTRLGREFGVVTPGTSLIVLETVADYLRFDIVPPAELRAEWEQRKSERADRKRDARNEHLDEVAQGWAAKREWWEKKFAGPAPKSEAPAPVPVTAPSAPAAVAPPVPPNPAGSANPAGTNPPVPAPAPSVPADGSEIVMLDSFVVSSSRQGSAQAMNAQRVSTNLRSVASADQFGDVTEGNAGESLRFLPGVTTTSVFHDTAGSSPGGADSIELRPWTPDAEYLASLREAPAGERYAAYLKARETHGREPAFFVDAAEFFFERNEPARALRVLSNLAELELESAELLRVLAHRLNQAGRPELALPLFERVLAVRGEEPQSRRDLALVCAATGKFQRAIDLLWEVVATPWDGRFPEIELIALGELNALVATCGKKLDVAKIDPRFRENLPVGLRAVLTWSSDACDIDLWVEDPDGEVAKYDRPLTEQGGRMSEDFTGGYGPEEFLLRRPKPGKYTVRIDYFGDRRATAFGPVTAQVTLITDFGTPRQKERVVTVRLDEAKENLTIGDIEIGTAGRAKAKR